MGISGIYDTALFLLVIVAVAVIAIMLMFLMTKRKNDLSAQCQRARDDVRKFRKQRLVLIGQALSMFSTDNKYAQSLSKLSEIYKTIDSESKEILWEEKYIKVMKKFMAYAKKTAPANMKDAWKMLNSSINENEMALDTAREAYVNFKSSLEQFDNPPQKYIVMASDKLSLGMHRAVAAKKVFDEQVQKKQDEQSENQADDE